MKRSPRIAPTGEQFEITFGDQRATVVEVGGGLRTYSVGSREILDGFPVDEMCPSGRGQVLMPWPNRIEDGIYEFQGKRHQLPLNELDNQNALHGLVRWANWNVGDREPDRVVMEHLLHPQQVYPFALSLSIEYSLSDSGLAVRTTAMNVGAETCPFGSGAHPYLTLGTASIDSVNLQVPARTVVQSDDRGIPRGASPVDGTDLDFRSGRPIGSSVLDNAFTDLERGEDGLARVELRHPDGVRTITQWVDESYKYLMIVTGDPLPDVNRRSLAVEPMTCPPNAFRTGQALVRLAPGESFTGAWGITA